MLGKIIFVGFVDFIDLFDQNKRFESRRDRHFFLVFEDFFLDKKIRVVVV